MILLIVVGAVVKVVQVKNCAVDLVWRLGLELRHLVLIQKPKNMRSSMQCKLDIIICNIVIIMTMLQMDDACPCAFY